MLTLNADGPSPDHSESWEIEDGQAVLLGRSSECDCSIPWDHLISRRQAEVTSEGGELHVRCLPGARNPATAHNRSTVFLRCGPGESFRIGHTMFHVSNQTAQIAVSIVDSVIADSGHTSILTSPADIRLAIVSRDAASLWLAGSEKELAERALQILDKVLTGAELLVMIASDDVQQASRPRIIHWHKQEKGVHAAVSRELISQASTRRETSIQVDSDAFGDSVRQGNWAFCVPVNSDAHGRWCIYVGGRFGERCDYAPFLTPEKLKADSVVTELVSHLTGAIRSVRMLERQFEGVRQFFSPHVLDAVRARDNEEELAPKEANIVAIYCDLRGFSRIVERGARDLHGLLRKVSASLGIMTQSIIEHQGVIADFQGDSALGFWGWPLPLTDGPLAACLAALQIQRIFELASADDAEGDPFRVGIGIAAGRAIAGRIGTRDQSKIGVFGPVVNLASRLEGLTRITGASILMDEQTAQYVRTNIDPIVARVRPIGRLQPAGFDQAVMVSELLPPESQTYVTDAHLQHFIDAAIAFEKGQWSKCLRLLALLPQHDPPRLFLQNYITEHSQPPPNWNGVIRMTRK